MTWFQFPDPVTVRHDDGTTALIPPGLRPVRIHRDRVGVQVGDGEVDVAPDEWEAMLKHRIALPTPF